MRGIDGRRGRVRGLRSSALAEDLLQTALAKSWFAWNRLDGDPEPYVRKVLVTTYATWWRRKWRRETPTSELPEVSQRDTTQIVDDRDELWQAMKRLPRRQRAVLVLRYFEDMSEAQIAHTLDISVGTVKSQASKALAQLRVDPSIVQQPAFNGGN